MEIGTGRGFDEKDSPRHQPWRPARVRAAAYEPGLDGVIIHGAPFDTLDAALSLNPLLRVLYNGDRRDVLNRLIGLVMKVDDSVRWAIRNGMYSFGAQTAYDMLRATAACTLRDVQQRITCDVLALRGAVRLRS
jgi:hypothetical protein